nr:DUF1080 domain-containing protein [Bacteroidales bacterium]
MKIIRLFLSLAIVAGMATACGSKGGAAKEGAAQEQVTTADDGFVSIFDGTTTNGWRGYNKPAFPAEGWEIVDGTLHCKESGTGEAGLGGDIIYDKKLSNFELSLEWKIGPGGNSGIFILGQEIPGEPIYKSSPEMQILDNAKHPDAMLGVDGNRQ